MSADLSAIPARCFTGVVPAVVATCSAEGAPNVAYISEVRLIDTRHIALSRQFFNKTARNLEENPRASVQLHDPVTFEVWQVEARFLRSETSGSLFDEMSARIRAIASHTGMTGVFRLLAADVLEVVDARRETHFLTPAPPMRAAAAGPSAFRTELRSLHHVFERISGSSDLDSLLSTLLLALEEAFGFRHSMLLLPDESGDKLFTVASRGYGESGVGSEIAFGDGVIGTAAQDRRMLCVNLDSQLRYATAVRDSHRESGATPGRTIPLPGLPDARSAMAVPLLHQDRLVGVLAVESREAAAYDPADETVLEIVAQQAAAALVSMQRPEEDEPELPILPPAHRPAAGPRHDFVYYRNDDCMFVNGEYLVRNVPGRILRKILDAHVRESRTDFSNRELRLDPSLGLPALKDNLESRLILLRRRLEQKCPGVRLTSRGRGLLRLEVDGPLELSERETS